MNLKSEYYASLAMDFLSITHSSAIKTVFTIRYGRIYGPTTKMDNLKYKFKVWIMNILQVWLLQDGALFR